MLSALIGEIGRCHYSSGELALERCARLIDARECHRGIDGINRGCWKTAHKGRSDGIRRILDDVLQSVYAIESLGLLQDNWRPAVVAPKIVQSIG